MSYKGVYFLGAGLASSTLTGLNSDFGVSAEGVVFSWVGSGAPDADRNVRAPVEVGAVVVGEGEAGVLVGSGVGRV